MAPMQRTAKEGTEGTQEDGRIPGDPAHLMFYPCFCFSDGLLCCDCVSGVFYLLSANKSIRTKTWSVVRGSRHG